MACIWGISALSHDASLAVVRDRELLFAGQAERYSRRKNDPFLHPDLLIDAMQHGTPDVIAWYERPFLKKVRHIRAGQWRHALTHSDSPTRFLRSLKLPFPLPEIVHVDHHYAHAAVGLFTAGFDDAALIVADSIGELSTFTIGRFDVTNGFQVLHRRRYPHSLGLLYSAFTKRCGFRPNEDEYIVMGMAAYGDPRHVAAIHDELLERVPPSFRLRQNVHRGIGNWLPAAHPCDLAASIQVVTEDVMIDAARWVHAHTGSPNLVLMGGIALNCVANSQIAAQGLFDRIWIFPNPGDAGSSVGAAAAVHGYPLNWQGPYLGTGLGDDYPAETLLDELLTNGIAGVASGRAEFGPRALGNRSLLADPRPTDMQDRVNAIKGREPFRPFAPVVRLERADEFFDMVVPESPYMQFTVHCRRPRELPAIVHRDGTSRIQTVSAGQHPGLHALLTEWEAKTGCAVLLNTSLNLKGEPLANSLADARRWSEATGVAVLT
jgi:carbamoyltransferase